MKSRQFLTPVVSALLSLAVAHAPAFALDKLRVAKSVDLSWEFVPLDIGVEEGIFAKYDLDVESAGSAAMPSCSKR